MSFLWPSDSCCSCRNCGAAAETKKEEGESSVVFTSDEAIEFPADINETQGPPQSLSEVLSREISLKALRKTLSSASLLSHASSHRSRASQRSNGGACDEPDSARSPALDPEAQFNDEVAKLEDIDRGVRLDKYYDFYNASKRKLRVRRMSGQMAGRRSVVSASNYGSGSYSCSTATSSDEKSSASDRDSSGVVLTPRPLTPPAPRRSEQDIITNWAVLVAILVRTAVLGFSDLAERVLKSHKKELKFSPRRYCLMASVERRAKKAFAAASKLAKKISAEPDCLHSKWMEKTCLLTTLFTSEYVDTLLILANSARKVFSAQPMLIRVNVPCRIFGDIHGQFRDLLLLFHAFGNPDAQAGPNYIFNGDFVDRGSHQLEVIGLLFALKVLMPDKVWLVRGNHEDRLMNQKYGFMQDCKTRLGKEFGMKTYDHIHKAFDQLPVACVVSDRVLVVHGGIGDGRWTLRDVETLQRPLTGDRLYDLDWIFNILWSDPLENDDNDNTSNSNTFGVHSSPRRADVVTFGWNVTKMFCARNGISLIVRSHECKLGGMGFDVMHERRLIRVFSARDYEENGNSAAVLLISQDTPSTPQGPGMLAVRPQVLHSLIQAQGENPAEQPKAEPKSKRRTSQRLSPKASQSESPRKASQSDSSPRKASQRESPREADAAAEAKAKPKSPGRDVKKTAEVKS